MVLRGSMGGILNRRQKATPKSASFSSAQKTPDLVTRIRVFCLMPGRM